MAPVEGVVLPEVVLVPDAGRVDDRVQHQPVDPPRVELRVDRAEVGAVRVAEVADPRRAQGLPDGVQVPDAVHGVDVRQHAGVLTAAGGGEGPRPLQAGPFQRGRGRHGVRAHRPEVAGRTGQGRVAGADPARVEPDDVVPGRHAPRQGRGDEAGERQTAAAGAAGIDQQGALGGPRGVRDAGQGEGELPARRVRVVQGYLQGRALEPRVVAGAARVPGELRHGGGGGRPDGNGGDRARHHGGGCAQHGCAVSHAGPPGTEVTANREAHGSGRIVPAPGPPGTCSGDT